MKKLFIALTIVLATAICGCNNQQPAETGATHQPHYNSDGMPDPTYTASTASASNATASDVEPQEPAEPTTFTTAKGTFKIDKVTKTVYDQGVNSGSAARTVHERVPSHKKPTAKIMESEFKSLWLNLYGKPDNEQAKEVYRQALEIYKKGVEDGWSF